MISASRLGWSAAILATSLQTAHAGLVSGKSDTTSTVKLLENSDSVSPKAKQRDGTAAPTNIVWEISNLSWIDEDTADTYLEITNTLTMPILATDKVTFHVEFISNR